MSGEWRPISTAPENRVVITRISDERGVRNEQPLKRCGSLWFYPDCSMYVYYRATHWKPADASMSEKG